MKIYFAGPDVFYPGYGELTQKIKDLCAPYNITPLCPGMEKLNSPAAIFQRNLELIALADGLIANLNPFHGQEPDSGTVFEVGYGRGLGKWIIGYLADHRDLVTKLAPDANFFLPDGTMVEDFGLPLNLMLGLSADHLASSLAEAIKLAASR
ncbi:MAG: nucleoside 2-deoxyribosyltransferase [Deltaproteobacteria bacterium]|jgi:nucleoside 2-deoxyribosyltransferase|nr:nucleoside 2-deoxyribosyltransferase [Deltaproteobacteria bacterium]